MAIKLLDQATDPLKTASKIQTAKAAGDLIGNEIDDKITKASKTSPQYCSKTVTNETGMP